MDVLRIVAVIDSSYLTLFNELINSKGAFNIITRKSEKTSEIDFSIASDALRKIEALTVTDNCFIHIMLAENLGEIKFPLQRVRILDEALFYLASNLPWLAHTKLEILWKMAATEYEKNVIQAIILLAAAQVKVQMDQKDTGKHIYHRSLEILRNSGLAPEALDLPEKFPGIVTRSAVRQMQHLFRERFITDWFNELNC